jgi:alpha-beta hydrolase superfamily lysophospholipase
LRPFLAALVLLTALPVRGVFSPEELRRGAGFFPLVGYLLGGVLALASLLPLPPGLEGALLLALWLGLTSFLHPLAGPFNGQHFAWQALVGLVQLRRGGPTLGPGQSPLGP